MSKTKGMQLKTFREMEPYIDREAIAIKTFNQNNKTQEMGIPVRVINASYSFGKTRFKVQPKYGDQKTFWVEKINFDDSELG